MDPTTPFSHDPRYFSTSSQDVINSYTYNKGTAFTKDERYQHRLRGLLPHRIETIEQQAARAVHQFDLKNSPMEQYIYLQSLRHRNETLFYYVLTHHVEKMLPIVYTPTVGQACTQFDAIWRSAQGMYLSLQDKGHIRDILNNWKQTPDIIVMTDGSRILGLGDLGANGMGIAIGKLSLYVAGAGFHPAKTLPICIDVGTNNNDLRDDRFYLGLRQPRVRGEEFYDYMHEVLGAIKSKWPKVLIQFEDWSNDVCFDLLDKYRNKMLCFNDDIQGTGAVILSGFINAVKLSEIPLKDHSVVFVGAGSAAVGVADQMSKIFAEGTDLSPQEIRERFYFIDSKGLVTNNRGDWDKIQKYAPFKVNYARTDIEKDSELQTDDLLTLVKGLKPTAIIGLSGQFSGGFTKEIIQQHASNHKYPIIFALSNPTSKSECTADEAIRFSEGRVIFASGSPFDPVSFNGKTIKPGQGNNMYIFPGLGLGSVLSGSSVVSEDMILAAAKALADFVPEEEMRQTRNIYPPLNQIREISVKLATSVCQQAVRDGLAREYENVQDWEKVVRDYMYNCEYVEPRYE